MKTDYWDVSDEQAVAKTGKTIQEWKTILAEFRAAEKKSTDVVAFLQSEHSAPRYWARTLTTNYLKSQD